MGLLFEYRQIILEGAMVTISLAVLSLILSVLLGLGGALLKLSTSRGLRTIGNIYTIFVRSVPDLVLMMLIFYGGDRKSVV